LVSTIVIVAVLISASLFLMIGQATKSHTSTETFTSTKSTTATVTTSTVTTVSTYVAPPPPVQALGQVGPSPLTIVGGGTACAAVVPAALGSVSLANFTLTLNATRPLNLTTSYEPNYEIDRFISFPPGITFTATDGIPNTAAAGPVAIQRNEANATVIAIPSGETTFHFQASVPNPFYAGQYFFDVSIFVSSKDTGGSVDSHTVLVSLDAQ
jgi:hypothetical protein